MLLLVHGYLDGSGRNLDMVKSAKSAVPVNEIGGSQLMECLQSDRRTISAWITSFRSFAQLPLVHKNCE